MSALIITAALFLQEELLHELQLKAEEDSSKAATQIRELEDQVCSLQNQL